MPLSGFTQTSDSVFETSEDPVTISQQQIDALIAIARTCASGRARLLLHPNREDGLHEMIIALPPNSCLHPHINFKSSKSFLALSGQFAVMRCSNDGKNVKPIILSAGAWPGSRMTRLNSPAWHTIIPVAGNTVFLETIIGPFTGNQFAPWFPAEPQIAGRAAFVERLRHMARESASQLQL